MKPATTLTAGVYFENVKLHKSIKKIRQRLLTPMFQPLRVLCLDSSLPQTYSPDTWHQGGGGGRVIRGGNWASKSWCCHDVGGDYIEQIF